MVKMDKKEWDNLKIEVLFAFQPPDEMAHLAHGEALCYSNTSLRENKGILARMLQM